MALIWGVLLVWICAGTGHAQIGPDAQGELIGPPRPDFPVYVWGLLAIALACLAAGFVPRLFPVLKRISAKKLKRCRITAFVAATLVIFWAAYAWWSWVVEMTIEW